MYFSKLGCSLDIVPNPSVHKDTYMLVRLASLVDILKTDDF